MWFASSGPPGAQRWGKTGHQRWRKRWPRCLMGTMGTSYRSVDATSNPWIILDMLPTVPTSSSEHLGTITKLRSPQTTAAWFGMSERVVLYLVVIHIGIFTSKANTILNSSCWYVPQEPSQYSHCPITTSQHFISLRAIEVKLLGHLRHVGLAAVASFVKWSTDCNILSEWRNYI